MLFEKLPYETLKEILSHLLSFEVETMDNGEGIIIYDEGEAFYGNDENDKWDLFSMCGIIRYMEHLAEERGKYRKANEIRKVLYMD